MAVSDIQPLSLAPFVLGKTLIHKIEERVL
jgi:hypothetical protein